MEVLDVLSFATASLVLRWKRSIPRRSQFVRSVTIPPVATITIRNPELDVRMTSRKKKEQSKTDNGQRLQPGSRSCSPHQKRNISLSHQWQKFADHSFLSAYSVSGNSRSRWQLRRQRGGRCWWQSQLAALVMKKKTMRVCVCESRFFVFFFFWCVENLAV